jgi:hypothetical protein
LDEPITISFTYTQKDARKAAVSFTTRWKSLNNKRIYLYSMIVTAISAFSLILMTSRSEKDVFTTIFLGLGILLLTYVILLNGWIFIIYPGIMGNQAKKEEIVEGETILVIAENKLVAINKISEVNADWTLFGQAYETPEYFILVSKVSKGSYSAIPIRAFSTEQYNRFRQMLQEKCQPIIRIM